MSWKTVADKRANVVTVRFTDEELAELGMVMGVCEYKNISDTIRGILFTEQNK